MKRFKVNKKSMISREKDQQRIWDKKIIHWASSTLLMNSRLAWFIGRRNVLEVPDKEGKEIIQSSPALQVGPRQTLLGSPLWARGLARWQELGKCAIATCGFLQWLLVSSVARIGQSLQPRRPQTESSALCGSLLQQLLAVGRDGAICVTGARIWPPSTVVGGWVSDVVWGRGCSLGLCFGLDHSIRDDLTHWAWTCFELRCIAYTCKTNLGTHKCVTNYFAPLQSVY